MKASEITAYAVKHYQLDRIIAAENLDGQMRVMNMGVGRILDAETRENLTADALDGLFRDNNELDAYFIDQIRKRATPDQALAAGMRIPAQLMDADEDIIVNGGVRWSQVASKVAGPRLQADIARRKKQGRPAMTRPYNTITLENAAIVPKDSVNMTWAEAYATQHLYTSAKDNTVCFTVNKTSNGNPAATLKTPTFSKDVKLTDELERGLPATVVAKTCAFNDTRRCMVLDRVVIPEMRYVHRRKNATKTTTDISSVMSIIGATAINRL